VAPSEVAEAIGLREVINAGVSCEIRGIRIGDPALIAVKNRTGNHTSKMERLSSEERSFPGARVWPEEAQQQNLRYAFDRVVSQRQMKDRGQPSVSLLMTAIFLQITVELKHNGLFRVPGAPAKIFRPLKRRYDQKECLRTV
jgi:hypothetical protein